MGMGIPLWKPKDELSKKDSIPIRTPFTITSRSRNNNNHTSILTNNNNNRNSSNVTHNRARAVAAIRRYNNNNQGNNSNTRRNSTSPVTTATAMSNNNNNNNGNESPLDNLERMVQRRFEEKEDLLKQLEFTASLLDQFLTARSGFESSLLPTLLTEGKKKKGRKKDLLFVL